MKKLRINVRLTRLADYCYQCSAKGIKNKLITKLSPPNIPTIGRLDFIAFKILISIIGVIEY